MVGGQDDLDELGRVLEALEPFLDSLLIVGGWAHRLYRFDDVTIPGYEPVFTTDTDIALPNDHVVQQDVILERLRDHGFVEEFLGDDRPPVTHYLLGDPRSAFYVEFLTPQGPRRRRERTDTAVIGGVVAQTLPHLEVLLIAPVSIRVSDAQRGKQYVVQVPNPVSYLVQKLLIMSDRSIQDRAKDILYVHDTIELYGARLEELATMWQKVVHPAMGAGADDIFRLAAKYFGQVTDDVRRGARVSGSRGLGPEELQIRCELGLQHIFGRKVEAGT